MEISSHMESCLCAYLPVSGHSILISMPLLVLLIISRSDYVGDFPILIITSRLAVCKAFASVANALVSADHAAESLRVREVEPGQPSEMAALQDYRQKSCPQPRFGHSMATVTHSTNLASSSAAQ